MRPIRPAMQRAVTWPSAKMSKTARKTACPRDTATSIRRCSMPMATRSGNNPAIVAECPDTQRRVLRFVGNDPSGGGTGIRVTVPLPNSFVFTACQGSAIGTNSQ